MTVIERESNYSSRIYHSSRADGFRNFDLARYHDIANLEEISNDMASLLVEMDVMKELIGGATVRQMFYVAGEGFYHSVNGNLIRYREFYEKAINDTSSIEHKNRFGAEMKGWDRAEKLLIDDNVEIIVIASPPGPTYRFENMMPLSATFLLARGEKGTLELNGEQKEGFMFDAFSLYIDEIDTKLHTDVLNEVADLTVPDLDPNNVLSIVSTPFVMERKLNNLNKFAQLLGFESWDNVEITALNLAHVNNEEKTMSQLRRGMIIENLKEIVIESLKSDTKWNHVNLSESIKRVLAKEAIGAYLSKTTEEVRKDILLTVLSMQKDGVTPIRIDNITNPFEYRSWQDEQGALLHNDKFMRMMAAHGGGGLMTKEEALMTMGIDDRIAQSNIEDKKKNPTCSKCSGSLNSQGKCANCSK